MLLPGVGNESRQFFSGERKNSVCDGCCSNRPFFSVFKKKWNVWSVERWMRESTCVCSFLWDYARMSKKNKITHKRKNKQSVTTKNKVYYYVVYLVSGAFTIWELVFRLNWHSSVIRSQYLLMTQCMEEGPRREVGSDETCRNFDIACSTGRTTTRTKNWFSYLHCKTSCCSWSGVLDYKSRLLKISHS